MSDILKYKIYICIFIAINLYFLITKSIGYLYVLLFIFFITNAAKLLLFIFSLFIKKHRIYHFNRLKNLPIYTILIPLYKEKYNSIRNLLTTIYNFNYDKEKLDVILLLEEDDQDTIANATKLEKDFKFNKLIIENSIPKTKPKACNIGLKYAKGQYLTIYDAEDIPDKNQLKKALLEFQELPEEYICLQARLNYYNKNENILTKCFSIEYSLYFEYYLQIFSYLFNFFPLSGTSNHFKVDKLRKLGGWDAYNVTEDAELGMRIGFNKYKMKTIDSTTYEEAVTNIHSWIKQRSRWIKGFLHTYMKYMSTPIQTFKNFGLMKFLLMQLSIGCTAILPLLYAFFFFVFIQKSNPLIDLLNIANLYSYLVLEIIILLFFFWKNKRTIEYDIFIAPYFLLYTMLPFYVSYISIFEFFINTSHWRKTEHCLSKYVK